MLINFGCHIIDRMFIKLKKMMSDLQWLSCTHMLTKHTSVNQLISLVPRLSAGGRGGKGKESLVSTACARVN